MNTRHLFAFNAHWFINLYARARGEMLSRTVTFNLSRGCLLLLESRLSTGIFRIEEDRPESAGIGDNQ